MFGFFFFRHSAGRPLFRDRAERTFSSFHVAVLWIQGLFFLLSLLSTQEGGGRDARRPHFCEEKESRGKASLAVTGMFVCA